MTRPPLSPAATLLVGAGAGLFASWVKVLVEAPMQVAAERIWLPEPGQKDLVGADPGGQPERMPPAVVARAAWRRLRGVDLDTATSLKAQAVIHYVFGAGFGAGYALLGPYVPGATRLLGAPAGAALYAGTHGSTLPALGVQKSPLGLPTAAVAWEGGSHVVFGVALECSRRLAVGLLAR